MTEKDPRIEVTIRKRDRYPGLRPTLFAPAMLAMLVGLSLIGVAVFKVVGW